MSNCPHTMKSTHADGGVYCCDCGKELSPPETHNTRKIIMSVGDDNYIPTKDDLDFLIRAFKVDEYNASLKEKPYLKQLNIPKIKFNHN